MSKIIDINGIVYNEIKDASFKIDTTANTNYETIIAPFSSETIFNLPNALFDVEFSEKTTDSLFKEYNLNIGYNVHMQFTFNVKPNEYGFISLLEGDVNYGTSFSRSNPLSKRGAIRIKMIPLCYTSSGTIVGLGFVIILYDYKYNFYRSIYMPFFGVAFGTDYHGVNPSADDIISIRELDITDNSQEGGGYGSGSMPHDNINIPDLPTLSLTDTGSTLYYLNPTVMRQFSRWLWTSDWQENIKKIRTDPMQNIIGVSIIDVPITGATENINIGNVDTDIVANKAPSFLELDCGTITLDEYYGTFADYEPFVATTLYLPKVGFVQIPADVCVNNVIKVLYHIELYSGEGLCYVQLTSKRDGFSYIWNTYTCHVTSNITLSAQDHSQQLVALGNAIINTGISASNAIINPASATQGLTNTLSSCIDVATTKNPTSTKGNVGNMSSVMCYKKPYLLINRTNLTKPSSFQENNGYLINYTAKIGGHTGFLKTRNYHAEFDAPYSHKVELERLMNEGVFING